VISNSRHARTAITPTMVAVRARAASNSPMAASSAPSESRSPRRRHPVLQYRTCSQLARTPELTRA